MGGVDRHAGEAAKIAVARGSAQYMDTFRLHCHHRDKLGNR
jgi:hypothetical protein